MMGNSRDDLLGHRTGKERAADYLHRRRPSRPVAPAQEAADALELFSKPDAADRELLPIPGWPDYRAKERRDGVDRGAT